MTRAIKHSWFFPHPPEDVWECLVNPTLLGEWLMKNDFQPVVGHSFQLHSKPNPFWDGTVYCEVLEIVPMQKLSFSWKGGPRKGEITLDSVVTWTITPKGKGTELQLEHTGFNGLRNYLPSLIMNKGWKTGIAKRFEATLNQYVHAKNQ